MPSLLQRLVRALYALVPPPAGSELLEHVNDMRRAQVGLDHKLQRAEEAVREASQRVGELKSALEDRVQQAERLRRAHEASAGEIESQMGEIEALQEGVRAAAARGRLLQLLLAGALGAALGLAGGTFLGRGLPAQHDTEPAPVSGAPQPPPAAAPAEARAPSLQRYEAAQPPDQEPEEEQAQKHEQSQEPQQAAGVDPVPQRPPTAVEPPPGAVPGTEQSSAGAALRPPAGPGRQGEAPADSMTAPQGKAEHAASEQEPAAAPTGPASASGSSPDPAPKAPGPSLLGPGEAGGSPAPGVVPGGEPRLPEPSPARVPDAGPAVGGQRLAGTGDQDEPAAYLITNAVTLRVRAQPGTDAPVRTLLPEGTRVRVLGLDSGWALVEGPGGEQGWVSASYLSEPAQEKEPRPQP